VQQAQQAPSESAEWAGNPRVGQQGAEDIKPGNQTLTNSVNDHWQCSSKENRRQGRHEKDCPSPGLVVLDLHKADDFRVMSHALRSWGDGLNLLAALFEDCVSD